MIMWLSKVWSLALGPLKLLFEAVKRNPLAVLLVLMLVWQAWSSRQQIGALRDDLKARDKVIAAQTEAINGLKDENARLNGSIRQLADMVAKLKPGESVTAEIPKPQYIPYAVPGPLKIEYIRIPGAIQTRVETIRLPGKDIEKIIDTAPQSIIAEFTATRDIKAGEKFRLIAIQISPGVYQPILDIGAPVTVDVRTVTPVDRIPTSTHVASRFSGRLYGGYGTADQALMGLRINYRLDQRWDLEGQGECRKMFTKDPAHPEKTLVCGSTDYRITTGFRF